MSSPGNTLQMKTHETRPFLFDHRVTGIARVAEDDVYDQKDSAGFINLFGLPIKVQAMMKQRQKDNK